MEDLERRIMTMLLDGDFPPFPALRAQYEQARVLRREVSGSGFDAYFSVPPTVAAIGPDCFTLGDVEFQLEDAEHPGTVLLFVRNGYLEMLEVFNWADDWPAEPRAARIHYMAAKRPFSDPLRVSLVAAPGRDWEWVRQEMHAQLPNRSA